MPAIPRAQGATIAAPSLTAEAAGILPAAPIEKTSLAQRNDDPNEVTLRFTRWHAHGSTAYQRGEFAGFQRDVAQRLIAGGVALLAETPETRRVPVTPGMAMK